MIFADTSFWVAWRNGRDPRHEEAARLLHCINSPILTTNHVRGETWTYLRRKAGHAAAVQFLDVLERSARVTVRSIPAQHEAEALTWLRYHDEREYSFVDATSFVTMRRLRIDQALAFDGVFSAAGFVELRP
jgi:uncharacterized protein